MKLDIIFAGAAKDEQQEKLLLDLLSPLGIDKHTMTEAKSDRKAMESALVTGAAPQRCGSFDRRLGERPVGFYHAAFVRRAGAAGRNLPCGTGADEKAL